MTIERLYHSGQQTTQELIDEPAVGVVMAIVKKNPEIESLCFSRFPYSLLKPIWLSREEIVGGERIEKSIEKKIGVHSSAADMEKEWGMFYFQKCVSKDFGLENMAIYR